MTIGTIIYLLILILGFLVSVFCLQYGAVAVVGTLIVVPFFMIFFLILMRLHINAQVECKNPVAEKDSLEKPGRASITLSLENTSKWLPVTKGIAWVKYHNFFSGESGKMKVRFSVDNGKKRSRRIVVPMQHCGNVSIRVEKVKIYDYLNIFAAKVGKNYEVQDVLVMPPLTEVYLGKTRWYNETNEDSDRFSIYKKGDDPSEIFDVRDFKDGDRFQQIHWKLSSKTGHYMVKEGSLPLAKAVHIFIDLSARDGEEADLLIQGVYSVAMEFLSQGVPQHFIWYDNVNELIQEQLIEQEGELFWMFEDLFQCKTTRDTQELLKAYIEWESGKEKESGLYLTVSDHDTVELEGLEVRELQIMDLRRDGDTYEE